MPLGAVAALAGVAAATVLYLTRDRHPELDFQAFDKGKRIAAGAERPTDMFTAMLGDRAYLAYRRDDDRLEVVAADAGSGKQLWRRQSATPAERWDRIIALPDGVALVADASGSSTPVSWRSSTPTPAGSGGITRCTATTSSSSARTCWCWPTGPDIGWSASG
ncbi:hypothetical protein EV384_6425 [Micromonospora kangleipakensis]|uniref:Uncharacterized protein n=1 Tax=Micromonospora kangleipakensis TaxID=1077942 RepID=A0A4V2GDY6_9ACTN|nr:hypothetical protein EV384_6425 [Micromonospora kangleipakensis]